MKSAFVHMARALERFTPFGLLRRIDRPGEYRAARIVLWWTAVTVVVIWTIAVAALLESRKWAIADERQVIERMSHVVEEQMRNELTKVKLFLDIVESRYLQHFGMDPKRDFELGQYVEQLRRNSNNQIDVRLVSLDGNAYAAGAPDAPPLANIADRDYILAQENPATRGLFIGQPNLSRITGHWTLPLSVPLVGAPGGIGTIAVAIDVLDLETLYETGRPKPNGTIALLSSDGKILVRAPVDRKLVGRSVANEELWRDHLSANREGVVRVKKSPVDQTEKLIAYVALHDFPLVVLVITPLDDVLAQWRRFLGTVLKIGTLLSAMILFLAHHLILRIAELSSTRNELEMLALTDSLTNLFNRRHFWERSQVEIARLSRYSHPLSLLALDIDHFKAVNDRYGHAAGDEALRSFAKILRASLRQADTPARLGGEEFAVLLPETSLANAQLLAERIRQSVETTPVTVGGATFPLTVSIGVVGTRLPKTSLETLLEQADLALYQAKKSGRNRTVVAPEIVPEAAHGHDHAQ